MSQMIVPSNAKEAQITATITRADGTVERLGVVSYWHKNPLKRIFWSIKKWLLSL
jgi:hypothetical protein